MIGISFPVAITGPQPSISTDACLRLRPSQYKYDRSSRECLAAKLKTEDICRMFTADVLLTVLYGERTKTPVSPWDQFHGQAKTNGINLWWRRGKRRRKS